MAASGACPPHTNVISTSNTSVLSALTSVTVKILWIAIAAILLWKQN